jgi:hypothetical protein
LKQRKGCFFGALVASVLKGGYRNVPRKRREKNRKRKETQELKNKVSNIYMFDLLGSPGVESGKIEVRNKKI